MDQRRDEKTNKCANNVCVKKYLITSKIFDKFYAVL